MTNPALLGHNEFIRRLLSFIKGLAVVGALLFFVDMKHKLSKAKKQQSKVKTEWNKAILNVLSLCEFEPNQHFLTMNLTLSDDFSLE